MKTAPGLRALFRESAPLFAALGYPARLEILSRLSENGPQSITNLSEGQKLTRQAITKHLRVMESSGLVHSKSLGRENVWQLRRQRMNDARRYLDEISRSWDQGLNSLKAFVED